MFAGFACGLALARYWGGEAGVGASAWFGLGAACVGAGVWASGWRCRVALWLAVVMAGAGWLTLRVYESPRDGLVRLIAPEPTRHGALMTLEGVVVEGARVEEAHRGAFARFVFRPAQTRWLLDVDRLVMDSGERAPVRGRVWVRVKGELDWPRAGQRVRATGVIRAVDGPLNPGERDARLWAAQAGVVGDLDVPTEGLVRVVEHSCWSSRARGWRAGVVDGLRARGRDALSASGGEGGERVRGRALLEALLLGVREQPELREVREAFTRQGLVHLLAISGFHMAVMAGVALFGVRALGLGGRREALIVALLVLVYMLIVPARTPVVRAGVLVLALLGAEATGRRHERLAVLCWAAVALLVWRPVDLWSLGYQLSFGVTAGLLWLGGRARTRLTGGAGLRGVVRQRRSAAGEAVRFAGERVKGLWSSSVLGWGVSAPAVAHHMGLFSPLGAPATVLVLPVVVVLLWAGFAVLAVGVVVPGAGDWAGRGLGMVAEWLAWVVVEVDQRGWSALRVPMVSWVWAVFATGVVAYWLGWARLRSGAGWGVTCALVLWTGVELSGLGRPGGGAVLRVDMLAVGDGSCLVVRSGGEAMLWDCGSMSLGIGERRIPEAVRRLGVRRIGMAVLTHADLDHYSALPDVVERVGVERVYVPPRFFAAARSGVAAGLFLEMMEEMGVEVLTLERGDSFMLGGARVEILWPDPEIRVRRENEVSLVARVSVLTDGGERSVLLTGDLEGEGAAWVMGLEEDLRADVLELPHHGSFSQVAAAFVERVDPSVVLQSTGVSRALDMRWGWLARGREWRATVLDGAAWVEVRRSGALRVGSVRAGRVELDGLGG